MKTELSKEAINLLDLLVSPVDANFELGKILLPNYKEEFDNYLFQKDFDFKLTMKELLQTYHFYKFWFAKIEFNFMDLENLNFLLRVFIRWEQGKIATPSLRNEVSDCFYFNEDFQTHKMSIASVWYGKICKEVQNAYSDEALEYFNRDL